MRERSGEVVTWREYLDALPAEEPRRYKCVSKNAHFAIYRKIWRKDEQSYFTKEYRKRLRANSAYRKGEIYGWSFGITNAAVQSLINKMIWKSLTDSLPLLKILSVKSAVSK